MKEMNDFERIYYTAMGDLMPSACVPWVEAPAKDSEYERAYAGIYAAWENLRERCGLAEGDVDLERILDNVLDLEQDMARRMFQYGVEYAQRGCRL